MHLLLALHGLPEGLDAHVDIANSLKPGCGHGVVFNLGVVPKWDMSLESSQRISYGLWHIASLGLSLFEVYVGKTDIPYDGFSLSPCPTLWLYDFGRIPGRGMV